MKTKLPAAMVAGGADNIGAACARVLAGNHFGVIADIIDPAPLALQGDISRYSDCGA